MVKSNKAAPALMDLHTIEHNAQFSAKSSIDGWMLKRIEHTLDDLLEVACGMQCRGRAGEDTEAEMLMASLGKYVQHLRNDLAEELKPLFKVFGVRGPSN